ncbi:hypothetical protein TKK_0001259 [Trichogramma kaykai]
MLQLLMSAGYKIDLLTRLRMLKCWMRVRGKDTDHLTSNNFDIRTVEAESEAEQIVYSLFIYREFNFYIEREAENFLHQQCKTILPSQPNHWDEMKPPQWRIDMYASQEAGTKEIMLTEDVSLYQICQVNYSRSYSTLKNMKNWSLPPMDNISCTFINIIVKRHLANIFIRPHLELFAADLFMTDYCKLNLPYTVCRGIAEHMTNEDILSLCEQTTEKSLAFQLPTRLSKSLRVKRQQKNEGESQSSPIQNRKRLRRQ